jgi:hypothetical protein
MDIITGERIQELADVYIGYREDFEYNPRIREQSEKHVYLDKLDTFDNPFVVFCYSHRIDEFYAKRDCFQNKFVLITHNSDANIKSFHPLLESSKVIKWYAQNLAYFHPKMVPLPIGIANEQWRHGLDFIRFYQNLSDINKTEDIFFQFQLNTNEHERRPCYDILLHQKNIPFLPSLPPTDNLQRMARYRYCVCPVGNGLDTHRFWEALYLQCVPIVLDNQWIRVLQYHYPGIPVILLQDWNELDPSTLPSYDTFNFGECPTLSSIQQHIYCSKHLFPPVNIVLVSVGVFQEYIIDNIKQLLYLGHENQIYVITNSNYFHRLEEFREKIHLVEAETLITIDEKEMNAHLQMEVDRNFRNQFWALTSSRLFYLYYAMRELNLENVFHLENDVLIYHSCDDLLPYMDPSYLYIPFDSKDRNIASVVYIPNHEMFRTILDHYDFSKNDMFNFSHIRDTTNLIRVLPIFPSGDPKFDCVTQNYANFGGIIFDAAAMGQFIGGVDPRNIDGDTTGFVNTDCIVRYDHPYTFYWDHQRPHFRISPTLSIPIFNLHIHCKRLDKFSFHQNAK